MLNYPRVAAMFFFAPLKVMARTAPAEEQLDMALRKLDACHRVESHHLKGRTGNRNGYGSIPIDTF